MFLSDEYNGQLSECCRGVRKQDFLKEVGIGGGPELGLQGSEGG